MFSISINALSHLSIDQKTASLWNIYMMMVHTLYSKYFLNFDLLIFINDLFKDSKSMILAEFSLIVHDHKL